MLGGGLAAYHELDARSEGMREKARAATHAGQVMGTDVESASRLNAVGFDEEAGAHFQRSIAENSPGFKNLGLDAGKLAAEPLTQALAEVGQALKNAASPADRAAAAMEIFGRSGSELLPVLSGLKQKLDDVAESAVVTAEKALKTKQHDTEKKEADRAFDELSDRAARGLGADEGFGSAWEHTKGTAWSLLSGGMEGMQDYEQRRLAARDRNEKAAAAEKFRVLGEPQRLKEEAEQKKREERQKQLAEAGQAMTELGERSESGLVAARSRDNWGNQNEGIIAGVRKQGNILGWSESQMHREIERQEQKQREGQLANRAWSLADSSRTGLENYKQDQAAIDTWKEKVAPYTPDARRQLAGMEKKRDDNYAASLGVQNPEQEYANRMADLLSAHGKISAEKLQRAAASAADSLMSAVDEPFMTSVEKFEAHMKAIGEREKEGAYTPDQARRRREAETEQELSHAGIRRPMEEFKKSIDEITRLKESGTITPEEYAKREKELRQQAVSGQLEGTEEVHAVAAMGAGSKEAYSAQVSAQVNDPRTVLAQATVAKLDLLVQAAQEAARKGGAVVAEASHDL
jgi:hypothetical protein